ncbi:hypothetical protein C5167_044671 [Papaver somniferum]|nr:hypothetical protein C5167_044671 [Papaver somniferum]
MLKKEVEKKHRENTTPMLEHRYFAVSLDKVCKGPDVKLIIAVEESYKITLEAMPPMDINFCISSKDI